MFLPFSFDGNEGGEGIISRDGLGFVDDPGTELGCGDGLLGTWMRGLAYCLVDAAFHVVDGPAVDKLGWDGVWRNFAGNGAEMSRESEASMNKGGKPHPALHPRDFEI